jgi:taurine transport system permease protein
VTALKLWSELLVPKPSAVWDRLIDGETIHHGQRGLGGYYLHEHLWASLWRIVRGVGLAIPFGVGLGLLIASVGAAQLVLEPYVNFVRALPPLGYFSLLIIWFGIDDGSKVWLLFLAAFPPITLSVLGGVRGIRHEHIDAAEQIGADHLGGGLAKNLFAAAEFNKALGQIPSVRPESAYGDAVDAAPAEQAAKR